MSRLNEQRDLVGNQPSVRSAKERLLLSLWRRELKSCSFPEARRFFFKGAASCTVCRRSICSAPQRSFCWKCVYTTGRPHPREARGVGDLPFPRLYGGAATHRHGAGSLRSGRALQYQHVRWQIAGTCARVVEAVEGLQAASTYRSVAVFLRRRGEGTLPAPRAPRGLERPRMV